MKFPLKLLEKALVVKLYGTTCIGQSYESLWLFTHTWLLKVLIVVLKHITLQYSLNDFLSLLADVPASSSDSPFPPETGQLCGPGGGEKKAANRDWLSQVCLFFFKMGLDISELHSSCCFCFLHWHISLVWCQECGKSFAFVFWITKKKIEVDENRVRVRFRSLCPYYTIMIQNYT